MSLARQRTIVGYCDFPPSPSSFLSIFTHFRSSGNAANILTRLFPRSIAAAAAAASSSFSPSTMFLATCVQFGVLLSSWILDGWMDGWMNG